MSDLVFVTFQSKETLEEARRQVSAGQKEHLDELGDALAAVKTTAG
jgi:uncharacterized membrane protein